MIYDDLDELPLIRPKMRGRGDGERVATFSRSVLNKSHGQGVKRGKIGGVRGGHPSRGRRAAATRKPAQFDRRAVIKARVVKMNNYGKKSMQLHIKYIERDGVEKDGSEGALYGRDDSFNRDYFTRKIDGEKHQFRFIVSPEDAGELELKDYTRELMSRMEKDLGRPIEWAAVNHYNTDNPHTHIVVRGVDLEGQELRIDREYISNGFRNRASEISTQWLGQRTELDIDNQMAKEVKQERYTSLDNRINRVTERNKFDIREYNKNAPFWLSNQHIHSRLDNLQKMGLAEKDGAFHWRMKEGWKDTLKDMGMRGDIIKNMHRNIGGDTNRYRIYDKYAEKPLTLEGRVADKGLSDELYDKQYLVVESVDGKAYHVDLDGYQSIQDYRNGDIVKLETKEESWLKPADEKIQAIASQSNGVYHPQNHLNSIEKNTIMINNVEIAKEDFVDAHVKRLHRLARYKLAEQLDDDSWKVSDNLVDELKSRDDKKPQRKLVLAKQSDMLMSEQKTYRGRTWLDRHTADVSHAKHAGYGFGADLNKAARMRAKFLHKLGIDPTDKSRARQLDKLQAADLTSAQASATGRQAVALVKGKPIKGKLIPLRTLKNGRRFVRIDSIDGKSFSIAPWHRSHDNLVGKKVVAGLTKEGRLWVKGQVLDIGR